jgi:hypothetical protein
VSRTILTAVSNVQGVEALLPWYRIQDDIQNLDIDILLLFDCCFAAQAGRAEEALLGRSELLAAAPMGAVTPKPGTKSFTVALMKEIVSCYRQNSTVIVKDLHAKLVARQARLHATPVHVPLRLGKRSIRLEQLQKYTALTTRGRIDGQVLQLAVHTRDDLEKVDEKKLVQWLGEDRPQIITSVKIIDTARQIQGFVASMERQETPLGKTVTAASTDDILRAWESMTQLVSQFDLLQKYPGVNMSALKARARMFLDKLESINSDFTETLGRSVISVRDEDDRELMRQAINDPISASVGILNALRMRQIVYSVDQVDTDLVEDDRVAAVQSSFQEVKSYEGYFTEEEKESLRLRIRHLAILLSAPKDRNFQTLRCYRCEHKIFERRFILHFEIPPAYLTSHEDSFTLTDLIEKMKASRPSLDERLKIGYTLAMALHKWHSAGWLHQGIASPNIRFFRLRSNEKIDFTEPFIQGFEFARPDSDPSLGRPTRNPYFDVYRHPSRQGPAQEGHRKIHDYYALGVVLLEIGLWQSATKMLHLTREHMGPEVIRLTLQQHCSNRLAHYAGRQYQEAVELCLTSGFDVINDDKHESQLLRRFYEGVVIKLGNGVAVRSKDSLAVRSDSRFD